MYFGWLNRKIPRNSSMNVLKKSFLGPFRVLEYFSTTRNDRIFLFPRALKKTYISMNSCILVDNTRKHPKDAESESSKNVFWVRLGFSNIFGLLETTEFFFFLGLFKRLISCIFVNYTRNSRILQYQGPQKKFFGSVSGSRNFFDYSKRPHFSFS